MPRFSRPRQTISSTSRIPRDTTTTPGRTTSSLGCSSSTVFNRAARPKLVLVGKDPLAQAMSEAALRVVDGIVEVRRVAVQDLGPWLMQLRSDPELVGLELGPGYKKEVV